VVAKRSDIYWVALDPSIGTEIQKMRPCVIVAPLTSAMRPLRFRVTTSVAGRPASVVLDQLRTVDGRRLGKRLGKVDARTMADILRTLQAMFSP